MGWSLGHDSTQDRDIGYGVPAYCDHPECWVEIDRGLAYVCGDAPYGGEHGCGLYFCSRHLGYYSENKNGVCKRCGTYKQPYSITKPEHPDWIRHKLTDDSWAEWRAENPKGVAALEAMKHGRKWVAA